MKHLNDRVRVWFIGFLFILVSSQDVHAAVDAAQATGGEIRQEQDLERTRRMEIKVRKKIPAEVTEAAPRLGESGSAPRTVQVTEIQIEDSRILTPEELAKIIVEYQKRDLTLDQMQEVADRITDAYRKKGYITSRAYLPVQSIKDGVLVIKVLEAKTGNVEIRGNRYFKTKELRRDLNAQPGGAFDFSALQRSLVYINEHPDRKAKAVLVPGKEPGTTDVIVQMEEQRPIHVGFEYDNYGSRYISQNRYSLFFEHDNLLGFEDLFYLKGQISDESRLVMQQVRYVLPVNRTWDLGLYAVNSKIKLGEEFDDLQAEGDAQIFGLFTAHRLIKTETNDLRLSVGFDYKSIRNKILGEQLSKDELRVLKTGLDWDVEDQWGRNIVAVSMDNGFSDIFGASESKDDEASRAGAGARFDKGSFTYFRLQPTPKETSLLWKNIAQWSNHNLTSSEQFQAGGALSVRGYPPAEHSGDSGIYSALELSVPLYFIPREKSVPFAREELLYDALRFVLFYDIATTHLNKPLSGEEKNETLRGYGFGMRFNLRDDLSLRCEVGYPAAGKPTDGKSAHPWVEFTFRF